MSAIHMDLRYHIHGHQRGRHLSELDETTENLLIVLIMTTAILTGKGAEDEELPVIRHFVPEEGARHWEFWGYKNQEEL